MDDLIKWLVGGGFFAGVGALLTVYFSGRKSNAEVKVLTTRADTDRKDADSKRLIEEKDAALRQLYEYVGHVKEWLANAHEEMMRVTLERDGDRRNMEDVRTKFDKLDHDYQDARVELARERANNAKLATDKVAAEKERDDAMGKCADLAARLEKLAAQLGEVK